MDARLNILLQKYYSKIPEKNLTSQIDYYLIESVLLNKNETLTDIRFYIKKKLNLRFFSNDELLVKMRFLRLTNRDRQQRITNEVEKVAGMVLRFMNSSYSNNSEKYFHELKQAITPRMTYVFSKAILQVIIKNIRNNKFSDLASSLDEIVGKMDLKTCNYLLKDFINTFADINGIIRRDDDEKDDLKTALDISKQEIESLKEEIEEIRDAKITEAIVSFLKELNSTQNNYLLDQFSISASTIKKLKKSNYIFPDQLESIPVNIRLFIKFLENLGVKPIAKINDRLTIDLESSENYEYMGTPFEDNDSKTVEIIRPGWKYAGEIISKPEVREVFENKTTEGE